MTTYAKQINDEYQSKLQDQLAEMRARFQAQLAANKGAFEEAYKNKVGFLFCRSILLCKTYFDMLDAL